MQHLVVLSDLQLGPVSDHAELWMGYQHPRFLPDPELAELLDLLCAQTPDGQLELVLNGDSFDFELPPVIAGQAVAAPMPRSEEAAVARMAQILDSHAQFLKALAGLLLHQHRVIFVIGNQDLQLNFAKVRSLLTERLVQTCRRHEPTCSAELLAARIEVHAWFYQTRYGVHIEHGHQYDPYCSVPDPLWPFGIDRQLQPNFKTSAQKHLAAPPPTSLRQAAARLGVALRLLGELIWAYGIHGPRERLPELQSSAEVAHRTLFTRPDVRTAMRLLRLDQALLLACVALTGILLLLSAPLGGLAALATLGLYEALRPPAAATAAVEPEHADRCARALVKIYGSRAVVFGHSQNPAGGWEGEIFYGSTGSWRPLRQAAPRPRAEPPSRSLIWLHQSSDGLRGGLYRFHHGELRPLGAPRLGPSSHVPFSRSAAEQSSAPFPEAARRGLTALDHPT